MAELWFIDGQALPQVAPLRQAAYFFFAGRSRPLAARSLDNAAAALGQPGSARGALLRVDMHPSASWVLLAPPRSRVRINGLPHRTGLRLLRHQDEVFVSGAGRFYFSSEELPRVEPFPGLAAGGQAYCPRCRQEITVSSSAVRCACGLWYHQSGELPCWGYSDRCTCGQPTALDAGFRWVPQGV